MEQRKMFWVYGTLTAIALALGASPAQADIIFGNVNPAPLCQAAPAGQVGHVCAITETFTSGADNIIANGFLGAPAAGAGNTNLTLKGGPAAPVQLLPTNIFMESGLGINTNATATCTDPECEIFPPQSVTATVGANTLITDAIIGSVQPGETFNFFVQTTPGGAFIQLNGAPIGSTCVGPGFAVGPVLDTCNWNAPPGQTRFGVAVQAVTGDELLSSLSTTRAAVPEPVSLMLFGTGLLGFGLLQRARRKV